MLAEIQLRALKDVDFGMSRVFESVAENHLPNMSHEWDIVFPCFSRWNALHFTCYIILFGCSVLRVKAVKEPVGSRDVEI